MAQNSYSILPFGAGGIAAADNSGTSVPAPRWYSGTAIPTAGTYNAGDVMYNATPGLGSPLAWMCWSGGTPGSWSAVFANNGATLTTTATSGTLTNGLRLILLNPASTGTYSLPESSANFPGFVMTIKNLASGSVTLTPLAADNYEATGIAAITLAQNGVINLTSVGTTFWYKAS